MTLPLEWKAPPGERGFIFRTAAGHRAHPIGVPFTGCGISPDEVEDGGGKLLEIHCFYCSYVKRVPFSVKGIY